jgi:two-component system, NtrC family, response regulator AtoC
MKDASIFIIENDLKYARILESGIKLKLDLKTEVYKTGQACLENLNKNPIAVIISNILPDLSTDELLSLIHKDIPDLPVIVISGHEHIREAVDLVRDRAFDYFIIEDELSDQLMECIHHIYVSRRSSKTIASAEKGNIERKKLCKGIIGTSPQIMKVFDLMEKAVDTDITVSITGETGTGKERVAKNIHYNSPRKDYPYITINLSATPSELVESELFGHEKGSFTGANQRRIGKFEEADKGSIFLDEISEIDLNMQAKLLRVLQEKEVTRVGSNFPVKVNVRVITATQQKLSEYVKAGKFRPDLYYRLAGLPIHLPALRERVGDIMMLARHFADEFCRHNKLKYVTFTPEAREMLIEYPYPGNVRELRSIVELAIVMASGPVITPAEIIFPEIDNMVKPLLEDRTLEEITVDIIRQYLDKYNHKTLLVAHKLGIGKSTLYRMMHKYSL